MFTIQQFDLLPGNIQQEVLDFMNFLAEKNGIELEEHKPQGKTRWLNKVNRLVNTGEPISATVVRLREEEKW